MNNFPDFSFEGLGGAKKFSFVPFTDVDEIPYTISNILTSVVVLKTGKNWYVGKSLPRTLSITEKLDKEKLTYTYSINGKTKGADNVLVPLFDDMARRTFIVDIQDFNGNRRLLGCLEYGAAFAWGHSTGETTSERSEYWFTFSIELAKPAIYYNISEQEIS